MFWMDGESAADPAAAALDGAWQMLVELRTGFPEIRSAYSISDAVKAARCLDRMVGKARKVAPSLSAGWPTIATDVAAAASVLRVEPDHEQAWARLMTLADELETAIAHQATHRAPSED